MTVCSSRKHLVLKNEAPPQTQSLSNYTLLIYTSLSASKQPLWDSLYWYTMRISTQLGWGSWAGLGVFPTKSD
uniref:Uncharacterized protein n=1 Tax=Nelumbo nucifera TaxID=4432 RepID=A0A822Y9M4_NELNU|nr:TPA_asm: hypothetical protein HUJ06_030470 [Nelumbo nucifera]